MSSNLAPVIPTVVNQLKPALQVVMSKNAETAAQLAAKKFRDAFESLKTTVESAKQSTCELCKNRCGASAGGSKTKRRRRHAKRTFNSRKSRRNHKKSRKIRKH